MKLDGRAPPGIEAWPPQQFKANFDMAPRARVEPLPLVGCGLGCCRSNHNRGAEDGTQNKRTSKPVCAAPHATSASRHFSAP